MASRGTWTVLAVFGMWTALVLGFWGAVIYAAVHFISKFW